MPLHAPPAPVDEAGPANPRAGPLASARTGHLRVRAVAPVSVGAVPRFPFPSGPGGREGRVRVRSLPCEGVGPEPVHLPRGGRAVPCVPPSRSRTPPRPRWGGPSPPRAWVPRDVEPSLVAPAVLVLPGPSPWTDPAGTTLGRWDSSGPFRAASGVSARSRPTTGVARTPHQGRERVAGASPLARDRCAASQSRVQWTEVS